MPMIGINPVNVDRSYFPTHGRDMGIPSQPNINHHPQLLLSGSGSPSTYTAGTRPTGNARGLNHITQDSI